MLGQEDLIINFLNSNGSSLMIVGKGRPCPLGLSSGVKGAKEICGQQSFCFYGFHWLGVKVNNNCSH